MYSALEPEKLQRIDYVLHPFLAVDIAVDVVAAADCGGPVFAVACLGAGSSKKVLVSD